MNDFISFRLLITPTIVQFIYWLLTFFAIFGGIAVLVFSDGWMRIVAVPVIFLGPILLRVTAECLLLSFNINENLLAILEELRNRP